MVDMLLFSPLVAPHDYREFGTRRWLNMTRENLGHSHGSDRRIQEAASLTCVWTRARVISQVQVFERKRTSHPEPLKISLSMRSVLPAKYSISKGIIFR